MKSAQLAALLLVFVAGCGDDEVLEVEIADESADPEQTEIADVELVTTIGPGGGTLDGSGVDGLQGFVLTIPPGALASEQEITLRATLDATPLPTTAAAVGPQVEILPAGLEFAQPASLTVPFDPLLRSRWDVPDDECRVWQREGEGWSRLDPVATTSESVTVELTRATTLGAGVFALRSPIGCQFGCQSPAPPVQECLNGERLCIESIGSAHTFAPFDSFAYTKGTLYWVMVPRSGQVALASFDVLSRQARPTTGALVVSRSVGLLGDVVVDDAGNTWVGVSSVGNVRFPVSGFATAFDTSSSARGIGVTFDRASRQVVRHRAQNTYRSDIDRSGTEFLAARGSVLAGRAFLDRSNVAAQVFGAERVLSRPVGTTERVFYMTNAGSALALLQTKSLTFFPAGGACGGAPLTSVLASTFSVSQTSLQNASICANQNNGGELIGRAISFSPGQRPAGRTAIDDAGNIYLAHFDRPQITIFGNNGGVTAVPLTDARIDAPEYEQRIPVSIHFDAGLDALYLVTRGDGTLREFFVITEL